MFVGGFFLFGIDKGFNPVRSYFKKHPISSIIFKRLIEMTSNGDYPNYIISRAYNMRNVDRARSPVLLASARSPSTPSRGVARRQSQVNCLTAISRDPISQCSSCPNGQTRTMLRHSHRSKPEAVLVLSWFELATHRSGTRACLKPEAVLILNKREPPRGRPLKPFGDNGPRGRSRAT